jgi:hypothetical protein
MTAAAECACTPAERASGQRYLVEVGAAIALLVASSFVSLHYLDGVSGPAKVALALLPMVGILAIAVAVVRFALRADEFVRQALVVSGAIAALASAVVAMALGYLETAGMARISIAFGWPLIAATFAAVFPIVRRRYR